MQWSNTISDAADAEVEHVELFSPNSLMNLFNERKK